MHGEIESIRNQRRETKPSIMTVRFRSCPPESGEQGGLAMRVHEHTCSGYDGAGPSVRGCRAKVKCTEPRDRVLSASMCKQRRARFAEAGQPWCGDDSSLSAICGIGVAIAEGAGGCARNGGVLPPPGRDSPARSPSEIRLLNLTFCRLSVSASRVLDL